MKNDTFYNSTQVEKLLVLLLTACLENYLVKAFVDQKILIETTGYQRNRVFVFDEYVGMF